jgi:hypothetical protein
VFELGRDQTVPHIERSAIEQTQAGDKRRVIIVR